MTTRLRQIRRRAVAHAASIEPLEGRRLLDARVDPGQLTGELFEDYRSIFSYESRLWIDNADYPWFPDRRDGTVVSSLAGAFPTDPAFGDQSLYLFKEAAYIQVMSVLDMAIDSIAFSGDLSSVGNDAIELSAIQLDRGYTAFALRMWGGESFGVLQMFITPTSAGAIPSGGTVPGDRKLMLSNLAGSEELHMLITATEAGRRVSDIQVKSLATTYLNLLDPDSGFLVYQGTQLDFVNVLSAPASISGSVTTSPQWAENQWPKPATVYLDLNRNYTRDANEPAREVNAGGEFRFDGLLPDYVYQVCIDVDDSLSVLSRGGRIQRVYTGAGGPGEVKFVNFTVDPTRPVVLSGTVKIMADRENTNWLEAPPAPGATLFLDSNRNDALDAGELTTTTDQQGNYRFPNLPPVSLAPYRTVLLIPQGYSNGAGGSTAWNESAWEPNIPNAFAIYVPARPEIVGRVQVVRWPETVARPFAGVRMYVDANDNNRRDEGEESVLSGADGSFVLPTTRVGKGVYVRAEAADGLVGGPDTSSFVNIPDGRVSLNPLNPPITFYDYRKPAWVTGRLRGNDPSDERAEPNLVPLVGWTVWLDLDRDGYFSDHDLVSTVDADGLYAFAIPEELLHWDYNASVHYILPDSERFASGHTWITGHASDRRDEPIEPGSARDWVIRRQPYTTFFLRGTTAFTTPTNPARSAMPRADSTDR
jgi:hypothetical protein